jgi:hypothetical protein
LKFCCTVQQDYPLVDLVGIESKFFTRGLFNACIRDFFRSNNRQGFN